MTKKLSRILIPLFGVLLFAVMLWVLCRELATLDPRNIYWEFMTMPWPRLALALGLTALAYAILPAYDFLGLRYVGRKVAAGRVVLISLLSFVFSNNIGFLGLSGGAVRLRHYTSKGLSAEDAFKLTAFTTTSFWLGLFCVAGAMFVVHPLPLPESPYIPVATMRPLGAGFLVLVAAYLWACAARKNSLRLWKWEIALPSLRLALGQLVVGSVDWLLAAAALYALLPDWNALSFPGFFTMFLLAQVVALISHVPGGLGVFETVMVLMLKPMGVRPDLALGILLVYRVVYYLLPLVIGVAAMGGYELVQGRRRVQGIAGLYPRWAGLLAPDLLAFLTFVGGVVLLFSGAMPDVERNLGWLHALVPLPLIDLSPFAASMAGIALILQARGLQNRLDGAYWLTAALLGVGIVVSLFRGLDYGEALVLTIYLAALLPCRREFYRHASLFSRRFTPAWITGIGVVLLALLVLALFVYKDQQDAGETFWQFELSGSALAIRLTVGVCVLGLVVVGVRMLRPAPCRHAAPGADEVARAAALAERSASTYAYLAILGDKSLLFNGPGTGFVMYSVSGRSWITMGDPVGPAGAVAELAREFHERCHRAGAQTVFYQVYPQNLHVYVDMGLSLIKIGEEGRVPLAGFSLTGRARKNLRHMLNKARDAGYSFRMAPAEQVAALMPELRAISDAWLGSRNLREKGFSLGFFDEAYLARFPIALVEQNGKLAAFANLWPGADRAELSIDLMRHLPQADNGAMDMLFIELMLWGASQGYKWFNLGMAPLSGLNDSILAPLWSRFGGMIYQHGENFYNFQGLRKFKEKFDAVWEPRYLASPGGMALPRILAEVTTLIRRGSRGRKESKGEASKTAAPGETATGPGGLAAPAAALAGEAPPDRRTATAPQAGAVP